MIKRIYLIILICFICIGLYPETVRISQIDTKSLLFDQKVKLYVSVTDNNGNPLGKVKPEDFKIYESIDNRNFIEIDKIVSVDSNVNSEEGINFLLLVDNSGSMYYDLNGRKTSTISNMRITKAKNAIKDFLSNTGVKDKIGLASYNSYYTEHNKPSDSIEEIENSISLIEEPEGEEAWSEIYSSLYLAIQDFSNYKGRKAIIVLSDGENRYYHKNTNKEHRVFHDRLVEYQEPIDEAQKEGISVFAINFGKQKDSGLKEIAEQSGGAVFDARDENELKNVYSLIKNQILNEYLIQYNGTMSPSEVKYVKVDFNKDDNIYSTVRYYFSSTLFGEPMQNLNLLILLIILLALILLFLLSLLKFQNTKTEPSIQVLDSVTRLNSNSFDLNKSSTIISSSPSADITIAKTNNNKNESTVINYDKKTGQYTIMSKTGVTVNNKKVRSKVLESGDLIDAGSTTLVFDKGVTKTK